MTGKSFLRPFSAIVVPAFFVVAAFAHDAAGANDVQKARHDHFHDIGDNFKAVRDQSKAATPDWAAMEKAAGTVVTLSSELPKWFPKGSGTEAGKTRALPEVWSKPDDFAAAAKKFADATPKLLAAAKTKDVAQVNAAFKEVGGACKNCHDTFRAPEDEH